MILRLLFTLRNRNPENLDPLMLTIGIHHLGTIASVDLRGKFIKGQGGHQLQMLVEKVLSAGSQQIILNLSEVPAEGNIFCRQPPNTFVCAVPWSAWLCPFPCPFPCPFRCGPTCPSIRG